jgi:hypothetical protein
MFTLQNQGDVGGAFREYTAKEWLKEFVNGLRDVLENVRIQETSSTTLGGLPAERATISLTVDSDLPVGILEGFDYGTYTLVLTIAMKGDTSYLATYAAQEPNYPGLLPTFERMLESVEFTD